MDPLESGTVLPFKKQNKQKVDFGLLLGEG